MMVEELPDPDERLRAALVEQARPRRAVPVAPASLDAYVGHYALPAGTAIRITRDGDRLLAELAGQPPAEILPESEGKFFFAGVPAQIAFLVEAGCGVTGFVLHQHGIERVAKRIDVAVGGADLLRRL